MGISPNIIEKQGKRYYKDPDSGEVLPIPDTIRNDDIFQMERIKKLPNSR